MERTLVCYECGKSNPYECKFCGGCGASIRSMDRPKTCSACDNVMRGGGLFTDTEMIMVFDDGEERFVHAFACPGCGQIRLMVDFTVDVEP